MLNFIHKNISKGAKINKDMENIYKAVHIKRKLKKKAEETPVTFSDSISHFLLNK